jgi:hypothetical protein
VLIGSISVSYVCLRRGQERERVFHSEAREPISNVIQTCDEEAREQELAIPLSQSTKRAAAL